MTKPRRSPAARAAEGLDSIRAARRRDARLSVEFYCREASCPAREFVARFKDYDDELIARLSTRHAGGCPICGTRLAVHWALTAREVEVEREAEARANVYVQRYRAAQAGPLAVVPAVVLCATPTLAELFAESAVRSEDEQDG